MDEIVYVINDMSAKLSARNVQIINQLTELNFDDVENVTYQMLIDARKESMGMAYGYPMYLNSFQFWVLPSLVMGLTIEEGSEAIKEYSKQYYIDNIMPTWDVELEEIEGL